MKPDRTMIELPPDLAERCRSWGERAAASGNLGNRFSSRGIESDPIGLADSKIAECVFALHADEDIDAIRSPGGAPWDVLLFRTFVDIKQTGMKSRFLIWPANKADDFDSRRFHVLASVKTEVERGESRTIIRARGYVQGWIGKSFFRKRRLIAGPEHILDVGTWYVPDDLLHRMSVFPGHSGGDGREHYCWCGEWASRGLPHRQWRCGEHVKS